MSEKITWIGDSLVLGEVYTQESGSEKGSEYVVTGVTPTSFTVQSTTSFYSSSRPYTLFHGKKKCVRLRHWQAIARLGQSLIQTPKTKFNLEDFVEYAEEFSRKNVEAEAVYVLTPQQAMKSFPLANKKRRK